MRIDIGRVSVLLDDRDDRICTHILDGSGFEPSSLAAWEALVEPGRVALDVGAYTGLYSIIAAKLGAEAVAIEPMPRQQARLKANALANGVKVKLIHAAASNYEGEMTLHHNPRVTLTSGASVERDKQLHRESIPVSCIPIDLLALPPVAIIKVDVEHHEPWVLRGAALTIAKHRPVLLVETLSDQARSEVLRVLPEYEVAAVLDRRNTLFVPSEKTSWLKDRLPELPT